MKNRYVLTLGTFDLLHAGHCNLFRECERYGNTVVVGLNSDEFVQQYKGIKPVFSFDERYELIHRLGYHVVRNDGPGKETIIETKPDVIVIGSDWLKKDYLKQLDITPDFLDEYNITLVYVPYFEGISATEIKRRLA